MFTSCAKDDDAQSNPTSSDKLPEPTEDAAESWTIMFYSDGGGNLDTAQVGNMAEAFLSTPKKNINMTFEFKFSKTLQANAPFQGAKRFDMSEQRKNLSLSEVKSGDISWLKKVQPTDVGDANYDMSTSAALKEFIDYSKEKHPAQHYMLILSDHGSGFDVTMDPETRAILQDDNIDKTMSIMSIEQGLKDAGFTGSTKIDVVYADACNMAAIENISQLQDVAKYFIGAEEITPGQGGNYTQLLNLIAATPANTMTISDGAYSGWAKDYVDYLVSDQHWNKNSEGKVYADCGVYDLQSASFSNLISSTGPLAIFAGTLNADLTGGDATKVSNVNDAVMHAQCAVDVTYAANAFEAEGAKITIFDLQKQLSDAQKLSEFITNVNNPTEFDKVKQTLQDAATASSYLITIADFMNRMKEKDAATYTGIHDNPKIRKCCRKTL